MRKVCSVINKMVSRHLPPGKIAPPPPRDRVSVWARVNVRIRAGGGGGDFRRGQLSYNFPQHEKNRDVKKSKFQKISSIVLDDW